MPFIFTSIRITVAALLALLLSSCATVLGPRTVVLTQDDLQQKISKLFPVESNRNLFSTTLYAPVLTLQSKSSRLALELKATVRSGVFGREYHGAFGASFGLRFDPHDLTLRLANVTVGKIEIDGLPAVLQPAFTKVGGFIAESQLEGRELHRFKPEDLGVAGRLGYMVRAIEIRPEGLALQLVARD